MSRMRILFIASVLIAVMALMSGCARPEMNYNGNKYYNLEYPEDILYYDYNVSMYCEEDVVYEVEDCQWDMIYCNGDLLVNKNDRREAAKYYANDSNYGWYVTIEKDDEEKTYPLELSGDMDQLYDLENAEKDKSLFFEEIEQFGTLKKVSNDGIISAKVELAFYEGDWYLRTEIIDEEREKDGEWPEYVFKLPEFLNENINAVKE